ncbi:hypothetical protein ACFQ9X_40970 [Catenulispora yoronensis]
MRIRWTRRCAPCSWSPCDRAGLVLAALPAEGASAAEGIRNQLGRPELDLLTILVRESAQNSWDARVADSGTPVDYRIDLWTVGPAHLGNWRDLLLNGAPAGVHLPLRESLRGNVVRMLAVSDRGTNGLGGPTRADKVVDGARDFVSFVRNIGEPRDTIRGGGTYGFGKAIFYLLSAAGTVLLYTRCRTGSGGYETRLMACAMWRSYFSDDQGGERRFTGRHWWGDMSGEIVEPLVDAEADAVAHRLGLRKFAAGETGTTVVVIDPVLNRDEVTLTPTAAADYMAESIAWQLWPKMIVAAGDDLPAIRFTVACDGVEREVPDPRGVRALRMFVDAYEQMSGPDGQELVCLKPSKPLGRLGLVTRTMPPMEATLASNMAGVGPMVHHVCLMRPAELVVTYWAGPKPPSEYQGYAGVFRSHDVMDDVYAKAEPPTHDAWNHQSLEYPESTYVRTTFRRIREAVDGLLGLRGTARSGAAKIALGAASSMFSGLVGGTWGTGGATDYGKPGSTAVAARPGRRGRNPRSKPRAVRRTGPPPPEARSGHRTARTSRRRFRNRPAPVCSTSASPTSTSGTTQACSSRSSVFRLPSGNGSGSTSPWWCPESGHGRPCRRAGRRYRS